MGRVLAIDYGLKRVGLAVSDPLKIIPNSLGTLPPNEIFNFLSTYFAKENVETVIIGYPLQMSGAGSDSLRFINPFIKKFIEKFPNMPLKQVDERFTSKLAQRAIIDSGAKKHTRQEKGLVDAVSAMIMLQDYLSLKSS